MAEAFKYTTVVRLSKPDMSSAHPRPCSGTKFPKVMECQSFLYPVNFSSELFPSTLKQDSAFCCSLTSFPTISRIYLVCFRHAVGSAPNNVSRTICFSNSWVSLYLSAQPGPGTCSPNTKVTQSAKILTSPPLLSWVNSLSPDNLIFLFGCSCLFQ